MMKSIQLSIYILLIVILICNSDSNAQHFSIQGNVQENETGTPIENVTISINNSGTHTHTDSIGNFSLQPLPHGTSEINFNKTGFHPYKLMVTISEGEIKHLAIRLKSKAISLKSINISSDKPVTAASSKYIGQIDFENRPKNSAQDMLRIVPGLFIAQHAGGGKAEQIFIRGFDSDHGTDVLTMVDGIPVNMPSHGHGQGYADLHFLIPETVERIDIFKGPYSPRYGDFATGAAIQFNTHDSLEKNIVQQEIGYVPLVKNVSSTRTLAMFNIPGIGSNINSYFAAEVINNRSYFEESQSLNRINLFSKTTVAVTDRSHLHFSISGFGSSWNASGQIPERAVKENLISRFGSIDNSEGGTTQRNNFNVIYHTQIENSEFETQVYTSDYRFKLFSNFTFFLNDPVNGDEIEQVDNRTIRGLNAYYSMGHKLGSMNNKFTLGTSFRSDNIENQLWFVTKRNRTDVSAHAIINQRSTGLYASETFRFSDQLRIEIGGRFDYFIFDVDDLIPTDSIHVNYSGFNYQTSLRPKFNLIYSPVNRVQIFLNAGSGFHSNDARSVVQQSNNHSLPNAPGAEIGTILQVNDRFITTAAFWWLELENELVYIGDEGTTENKGASRRTGIDLSMRYQLTQWLYADVDLNIARNRFIKKLLAEEVSSEYYIPLAPSITSTGGLTARFKNGFETTLRYRYLADRPANETNTIKANGYNVFDFTANYFVKRYKVGLQIENLSNTEWNEAQFNTESRLANEITPVEELHFTPGTPLSCKITMTYSF